MNINYMFVNIIINEKIKIKYNIKKYIYEKINNYKEFISTYK